MSDLPKVIRDQPTEDEIRADERGQVEREITADWIAAKIRECDGNHTKGAGAIGEYVADAIQRGEYRKTEDDKP